MRRFLDSRASRSTFARSILVLALLSAATPAAGEAQWQSQVKTQILESGIIRNWLEEGFVISHDAVFDVTNARGHSDWWFTLANGWHYHFIGKCDVDCTDLDFELFDANGRRVSSDLARDDDPVVEVTPPASGRYRLRVTMASCVTRNCGWGAIAFRK